MISQAVGRLSFSLPPPPLLIVSLSLSGLFAVGYSLAGIASIKPPVPQDAAGSKVYQLRERSEFDGLAPFFTDFAYRHTNIRFFVICFHYIVLRLQFDTPSINESAALK